MDQPTRSIPEWLSEGFEGEPTDSLLNKRDNVRHVWVSFACGRTVDDPEAKSFTAKTFNVSRGGIGIVVRQPIEEGITIEIGPDQGLTESIRARVMHCTQTVGGYKLGCLFVDK